ncbi:MAG TPA: hypothetical protein H9687_02605 [Firmicutes bacterium]|nr:hypothetical protein [Bacillota bacterium]
MKKKTLTALLAGAAVVAVIVVSGQFTKTKEVSLPFRPGAQQEEGAVSLLPEQEQESLQELLPEEAREPSWQPQTQETTQEEGPPQEQDTLPEEETETDFSDPPQQVEQQERPHTSSRPITYINDPALTKQWNILDETATTAQKYYTENFSKTRLITKDGYLYNKAAEARLDIDYFVAEGDLPSSYRNQGVEILLLNCDDLRHYDGFVLKSSETGLAVFAAMKHPTENVYLLTTGKSAGGALTAAQYSALLNSYRQSHGAIGRLYPGAEQYSRILSFISMYESQYEQYAVRSIISDDKYAIATLSPADSTGQIREYVLERNGSIWEVVVAGLESDPRAVITVNRALPDFNLNMLPAYCINDYRNSINTSNLSIVNQLLSDGKLSGQTEVKYICSTSNFGYVVLANEVKYLCTATGDGWNIVLVSGPDEAREKMLATSKTAPTFIILDQ